jgi:hypothetical protein
MVPLGQLATMPIVPSENIIDVAFNAGPSETDTV